MAIGYRSVLRLSDNEDAARIAREQFRSWLSEMVRDPRKDVTTADWDGNGTFEIGPNSSLTVIEHSGEGRLNRILLELVENNAEGKWTTRLYASSAPTARTLKQMLWFESEGQRLDGSPAQPGTPRIVRNTLQTINAFDGAVPVLSQPRIIRTSEVDDLMDFIQDPDRALSIIVAAPVPKVPVDRWAKAVASLTRDSLGCASFFVLDPAAENALNQRLESTHSVPSGAVRTFVPRVEVGDWADARRHRILTARTMSQGLGNNLKFSERLIRAVATTPRLHLLEAEMPAELTRTVRVLQRERITPNEIKGVATPLAAIPETIMTPAVAAPADTKTSWVETLRALVRRIVGRDTIDDDAIQSIAQRLEHQGEALRSATRSASTLQMAREVLEDQIGDLRRQLEAEQFERALADAERRESEKKTRALERWRAEREDRYTFVEETSPYWESDPASVSEIVERLTDIDNFAHVLKYVELTGVEKAIDRADALDAADPNGTYASSFWEYILVLRDYMAEVAEEKFSGNVHMYLNSESVRGRKCPTQRHRANESETVQSSTRMRKERTFPVPQSVDPLGETFMTTHFAPTHRDQNAPRMYYFADNSNQKVYIGYIGVHLRNTKTT